MRDRAILLLAVAALVVAACGGGATTAIEGPDESAASTTTTQSDTTTSAPTSTTTTSSDAAFTRMEDLTYLTVDGEAFEGDIYVPEGEGPWPVVVMFHGNSASGKNDTMTTVVAEAAATAGIYVFVPNWLTGVTRFTPELFDFFYAAANCAVAYAQPDPDVSLPVVVYGFSAGVGPASLAALDPASEPIPGCVVENPPAPITGAVFGDGEYFLQSTIFDGAFAADPEAMQARVATVVDPSLWSTDMETRFFLWFADEGTLSRTFDDPWDETGWLAQRDPDGSIREDLDRLGQLDDGAISFIDEGQFMALRLGEAGIEVTLDNYPGGHSTLDKVPELVGYLLDAAAID
jgi:acetyl esterase/lipase